MFNLKLNEKEIENIALGYLERNIEEKIQECLENLFSSGRFDDIFAKVIIDFAKSEKGKKLIEESFTKYYMDNGDWLGDDALIETIDEEASKLVRKMFKNMTFTMNNK